MSVLGIANHVPRNHSTLSIFLDEGICQGALPIGKSYIINLMRKITILYIRKDGHRKCGLSCTVRTMKHHTSTYGTTVLGKISIGCTLGADVIVRKILYIILGCIESQFTGSVNTGVIR